MALLIALNKKTSENLETKMDQIIFESIEKGK